jgi:signal transduction histidine kinase
MRQWLKGISKPTIRLTATYLAIIVCVSIIYTVVMYQVTTRGFVLQLNESGSSKIVTGTGTQNIPVPSDIATGLQSKTNIQQNLVLLNAGVVLLGIPFCYLLARRTLKPIEAAMDNQARFSSDAAHELRTPVTALRVRNEVALRNPKLSLSQARKIIQDSADQALRLEKLSEALLQLSRDDTKNVQVEKVHLEDIANDVMNLHIDSALSKRISICDEVPDISVLGNRQDIVQIVSILLDNAIKYSPNGSTILITGSKDQKVGSILVRDNGQGIRAVDIPHIFDRFYRADHARTVVDTHSYGLGLSIAQKLARYNNGSLHVKSVRGKGSTFTVDLPLSGI